jgi:hypothetical protein
MHLQVSPELRALQNTESSTSRMSSLAAPPVAAQATVPDAAAAIAAVLADGTQNRTLVHASEGQGPEPASLNQGPAGQPGMPEPQQQQGAQLEAAQHRAHHTNARSGTALGVHGGGEDAPGGSYAAVIDAAAEAAADADDVR